MSYEEFVSSGSKRLYQDGVPVVVRLPDEVQHLGRDGIVERLGELSVTLFKEASRKDDPNRWTTSEIRLRDFFTDDRYVSDPATWHRVVSNIKNSPGDVDAVLGFDAADTLGFGSNLYAANLWVSHRSVFTKSHFDEFENFNIALEGRKRFVLAPPGFRSYYPRPFWRGLGDKSRVFDFDDVDPIRWPRLARRLVQRRELILNPGEMLYLPIGWWHQAESLDDININVNFWMRTPRILRMPHVLGVALYTLAYRRLKGIYAYRPSASESTEADE